MRTALCLLLAAVLAACSTADTPPDGVTVTGDEARVFGLALIRVAPDGSPDVSPDPPPGATALWLAERGFVYQYFDPDTTRTMERVLAPLQEGRPRGEGVIAGYSVYTR